MDKKNNVARPSHIIQSIVNALYWDSRSQTTVRYTDVQMYGSPLEDMTDISTREYGNSVDGE